MSLRHLIRGPSATATPATIATPLGFGTLPVADVAGVAVAIPPIRFLGEDVSHELDERAAIVQFEAGAPRAWAEGFARLDRSAPPKGFSPARWHQVINDGGRFLDRWASKAAALGWDDAAVFGVEPRAPGWRLDNAGLVVLIDGAEVTAITDRTAMLRLRTGAVQVYHRQDSTGAVPLWALK